jgi:hypothetical protein
MLRRAATVALLALALLPAGSASASVRRTLCVDRTVLRDSPGGFVIGHLYRPQTLLVVLDDDGGDWSFVEVRTGAQGWVATRTLCKAKKPPPPRKRRGARG